MMFSFKLFSILILTLSAAYSFADTALNKTISLANSPFDSIGPYLEILPDSNAELSPFQIIGEQWDQEWQPVTQMPLNLGATRDPHWIRFEVDASASVYKLWDLVISEPTLDYVDLYQVFDGIGPRLIYRSGMKRAYDNRNEDHRFFIIPLEIFNDPSTPIEFLMRVETQTGFYMPMKLYPDGEFWASLQRADILNWMFFGVVVAMSLYNLFLFFVVRDVSYLFYVLFISCFALLHLSQDGYVFQHFWPEDKPYSYIVDGVLISLTSFFSIFCVIYFLDIKNELPSFYKWLILIAVGHIVTGIAVLYYPDTSFFSIYTQIISANLLLSLWIGIRAIRLNLIIAKYFTAAWLLFSLGNLYFIVVRSGINIFPVSPLIVSKAAAFAETMLLSFALARRIRILSEDREKQRIKAEAQSYFLAQISHEIRTPLNGVIGTVELLDQTILSKEQMTYIQTIKASGHSLLTLVNDVLDYSKIEAGKMHIRRAAVDLHNLTENQVNLFRYQAEQKGLKLNVNVANSVPKWIESDAQRLRQILLNLISNAIKFTDQGSVDIYLSVVDENSQKQLEITVKDTGIGIAQKDMIGLFRAYQQVDSDNRKVYGGTGLGLAISFELATAMGGELRVESQLKQGSEFCVSIPLILAEQPRREKAIPIQSQTSRSLNILVAEDILVNQRVIIRLLENMGHIAYLATNGEDAVQQVKNKNLSFDLVLMDCEMPILNGYDATRKIRQYETENRKPPIPIIALTAHAFDEVREKCFEVGMNEFLTKPLNRSLLTKTINAVPNLKL